MIRVEKKSEGTFLVSVSEGGSETSHTVTVSVDYCRKLTGESVPVEDLIQSSFEFLLEREPKESILRKFDLPVIARYFPEYERAIRKRLGV